MKTRVGLAINAAAGAAALFALAPLVGSAATSGRQQAAPVELPFKVSELFFELNNTDGDLGVHARIDGADWKQLWISSPQDRVLFQVQTRGGIRQQGLNEVAFESAEPNFTELPPAQFFQRFPEGVYEFNATTINGEELSGEATISHVIPAPAVALFPASACAAPAMVTGPVTIRWAAVTRSHPTVGTPGQPIDVERYELAIERLDNAVLKMSIDLPPNATSFTVPINFTSAPGTVKFQILVKARNGNRTGQEGCFKVG
jgi:hypothetical protein